MNRVTLSKHTAIWFNNCYKISPFIRNKIVTNKKILWEHKNGTIIKKISDNSINGLQERESGYFWRNNNKERCFEKNVKNKERQENPYDFITKIKKN